MLAFLAIPQWGMGKPNAHHVRFVKQHQDSCHITQRAVQGSHVIKLRCDYSCENPTATIDANTEIETITCHPLEEFKKPVESVCHNGDACNMTAPIGGTEVVN